MKITSEKTYVTEPILIIDVLTPSGRQDSHTLFVGLKDRYTRKGNLLTLHFHDRTTGKTVETIYQFYESCSIRPSVWRSEASTPATPSESR